MKKLPEKILSILPYFILLIVAGSVLLYIYIGNLAYEEYIQMLQILIWPSIVLMALLFFRKVFTFLFFSMEEFNFFGNKGKLKNVEEVINEKVEERIKRDKEQADIEHKMKGFEKELEKVTQSKDNEVEKSKEYRELAVQMAKQYQEMSNVNKELNEELNELRRYKQDRIDRLNAIRRKFRERRIKNDENTFDPSENVPKANKETAKQTDPPVSNS